MTFLCAIPEEAESLGTVKLYSSLFILSITYGSRSLIQTLCVFSCFKLSNNTRGKRLFYFVHELREDEVNDVPADEN